MTARREVLATWIRALLRVAWTSDLPPAVAAFCVYLLTLAPGATGFDSAELATGAYTLGIVHPTGYPLYLLLGKAFTLVPVGSIAFRVNLLSAASGALATWVTARLGHALTRDRWIAWGAAATLAFSYSFWRMSVVAEVYTLQAVLIASTLLAIRRWGETRRDAWLVVVGLAHGLSLANHVSAVFVTPGIALELLRASPTRTWPGRALRLGLPVLAALALYLYLPIRAAADPPLNYVRGYYDVDLGTPQGLWWMVSGQAYRFFAFRYDLPGLAQETADFVGLLVRNFTPLGVILGAIGVVVLARKREAPSLTILTSSALHIGFFIGYAVGDKSTMFIPAYVSWALLMAAGTDLVTRWIRGLLADARARLLGQRLPLQLALCGLALAACAANWTWVDLSQANEPDAFARQVLSSVAEEAVIVGPWSTAVILEYYQLVEGLRPDVFVFNRSRYEVAEYYGWWREGAPHEVAVEMISRAELELLDEMSETRPLYVLDFDPRLTPHYEYQSLGVVFRLLPRASTLD